MSDLQAWMNDNTETDGSLAPKLGISRVQVRRIRLGENKPSRETALKLEEVTGIPAPVFIFGSEGRAA